MRILSVGPNPAIEALFETKNNCKAHDEEGNAPTDSPEVVLRLIRIGDALQIHSEIRLEVFVVSITSLRWIRLAIV